MENNKPRQQFNVKVPDEMLSGVYANAMQVTHSQEEFVLDFINVFPPQGIVTTRVIISPGHLKRIVDALQRNLRIYEERYGQLKAIEAPKPEVQYKTD